MISPLTGIQIGPRQLELPPNIPDVGLGRQVGHPVFLAPHAEHVRMLGVDAGQGPDAVGAQELPLVEHDRQDPAELRLVQDRAEPPAPLTRASPGRG